MSCPSFVADTIWGVEIPITVNPQVRWVDDQSRQWVLTFYWANVDGWSRLIGLDMHSWEGRGIGPSTDADVAELTSALLRQIPLSSLGERALAETREGFGGLGAEPHAKVGRPSLGVEGPDGLRRVAEVYRNAHRYPVQAVAEQLCLGHSAAKKRVQRARRLGLL